MIDRRTENKELICIKHLIDQLRLIEIIEEYTKPKSLERGLCDVHVPQP